VHALSTRSSQRELHLVTIPAVSFHHSFSVLTILQRGEDARFQSYHYARAHMPAFYPRRCSWHIDWMEFRPHARTHLAYHGWTTRIDCWFRDRGKHVQHRGSLSGLLYLPNGRILGELGYYWVGVIDAQSNEGEESSMFLLSNKSKDANDTNVARSFSP
jgi:hypothetical protein